AVAAGEQPLAWRTFALEAGKEGAAVVSAVRTLRMQSKNYGVDSFIEHLVIHGRPELHERLQEEQLPTMIGVRVIWQKGPAFDCAVIAQNLAADCLKPKKNAYDLSRTLKGRASLREIFPWWDLVYCSILILIVGATMLYHSIHLEDAYATVHIERANHKQLTANNERELKKKADDMSKKVDTVRKLLEDRINWSDYIRDMSERLPPNIALSSFNGQWSIGGSGKRGRANKSLVLSATLPVPAGEATPRELDALLESFRKDSVLKKNFGSAKLTGISQSASRDDGSGTASFTIICTPESTGGGKRKK
ncbi:MAG: hypothetical protein GX594_11850, partial [Pirellulaceae bacterium]|nr:hypothetical protein [Pirellulaceae bacterium]